LLSKQGVTGNRVQIPSGPATVFGEFLSIMSLDAYQGRLKETMIREPGDLPSFMHPETFAERSGVRQVFRHLAYSCRLFVRTHDQSIRIGLFSSFIKLYLEELKTCTKKYE
jgi:hypothetical protein